MNDSFWEAVSSFKRLAKVSGSISLFFGRTKRTAKQLENSSAKVSLIKNFNVVVKSLESFVSQVSMENIWLQGH